MCFHCIWLTNLTNSHRAASSLTCSDGNRSFYWYSTFSSFSFYDIMYSKSYLLKVHAPTALISYCMQITIRLSIFIQKRVQVSFCYSAIRQYNANLSTAREEISFCTLLSWKYYNPITFFIQFYLLTERFIIPGKSCLYTYRVIKHTVWPCMLNRS